MLVLAAFTDYRISALQGARSRIGDSNHYSYRCMFPGLSAALFVVIC